MDDPITIYVCLVGTAFAHTRKVLLSHLLLLITYHDFLLFMLVHKLVQ